VFVAALMAGALLGYLVLQNRPLEMRMVLVALATGCLITTVAQGIIPERRPTARGSQASRSVACRSPSGG